MKDSPGEKGRKKNSKLKVGYGMMIRFDGV
jgi:hypothetical protein